MLFSIVGHLVYMLATCSQICAFVHVATSLINADEAHEGLTSSSNFPFTEDSKSKKYKQHVYISILLPEQRIAICFPLAFACIYIPFVHPMNSPTSNSDQSQLTLTH